MIDKVREIALKVLYEVDEKDAYSNIALDEALKQMRKSNQPITNKDVGFLSEIVYGTVSWKLTIDEIIKKYSKIKLKKISPWILNILRMGVYQIVFLDRVPKSAAVNEGVELAKRYGHRASSNFVNAILRKVEKKDYDEFSNIENVIERISKTTSMPEWVVEELLKDKEKSDISKNEEERDGKEKDEKQEEKSKERIAFVEQICRNSNKKPLLHIRVNCLKTNPMELKERLEKEGVTIREAEVENFLQLEGAKNIEKMKAFQEGWFTVQDEMAGFIPLLLNPKPNQIVLDACSSPGGKTTAMAEWMKNQGRIVAWDLHEHRVELVNGVAKRLGIKIIDTEIKDATIQEEKYFAKFDKILLDVPCLGLGVLKRKPDIKWKRKKEDILEISNLQQNILQNCSSYLKEGGELLYSTCSILKEENEEVIEKFLEKNKNFVIEKIEEGEVLFLEKFFENFVKKEKWIQVYPNEKTDGFFMCKVRKIRTKK